MRYKILICAYSCVSESGVKNIGGEAELGWNIVKELGRFFDVYVLTHAHNQKSIKKLLLKDSQKNINFIYIRLPKVFNFLEKFHKGGIQIYSYLWQIKAYFIVKNLHKKYNFDLFHHITYANDWMASYIGALLPIPYIRGPGGGAHKVPKEFTKQYNTKQKLGEIVRSIGQFIFRHDPFFIIGQNKAKTILVCNKESFDALSLKWQKKALLFPVNGISKKEFEDFKNLEVLKNKNNFVILSAGKLIKIKGFDLVIKSFKFFNDKFENTTLKIIGSGPEEINLKKIVQKLGLENKVVFDQWVPREKLLKEMFFSDIFLFLSLRDGGGQVVVEAMASGKPVVCFDIAGPGFHIDESCGIKIKPENPEQAIKNTAIALEKLYKDKELRKEKGKNGKEKAEREYEWEKLGNKLKIIYEKFL